MRASSPVIVASLWTFLPALTRSSVVDRLSRDRLVPVKASVVLPALDDNVLNSLINRLLTLQLSA